MYKNKFSGKLAIFCSDERFVKSTLAFLSKSLDAKHCDLMIVPGGPAFIINNEKSLIDRLKLLVRAHGIKSIYNISHADCGYYKYYFKGLSPGVLVDKQLEDLRKCRLKLNKMFPGITVKNIYIDISEKRLVFKRICKKTLHH